MEQTLNELLVVDFVEVYLNRFIVVELDPGIALHNLHEAFTITAGLGYLVQIIGEIGLHKRTGWQGESLKPRAQDTVACVIVDAFQADGKRLLVDLDKVVAIMPVSLSGQNVKPHHPVGLTHQTPHDLAEFLIVELAQVAHAQLPVADIATPRFQIVPARKPRRLLHKHAELSLVRTGLRLDHYVVETECISRRLHSKIDPRQLHILGHAVSVRTIRCHERAGQLWLKNPFRPVFQFEKRHGIEDTAAELVRIHDIGIVNLGINFAVAVAMGARFDDRRYLLFAAECTEHPA